MQIVHVHVNVKPEFIDTFKQATIENASNSIKERGIARFDVLQQTDDPTKFILVEIYKTADASGAHKETAHYKRWRDTVMPMMAEPRRELSTAIFSRRFQLVMESTTPVVGLPKTGSQSQEMAPRRRFGLHQIRHKDMFSFEFATASRIIFGAGRLNELGQLMEGKAKHVLLVRGGSSDAIPRVRELLSSSAIPFTEFSVHGEPTVDIIREGMKAAHDCDMIIGLGGGSVVDTGKAIAALATNPGDIFDYLEVIGKGQHLVNAPLPYIAIPTTAGTGAEVTRNAVIESTEQSVKVSLRSPLMLPQVALVDPELTYTCHQKLPPAGLDALTQLIEPFVSVKANPLTDAICREGMAHAARSLRRAFVNGADKEAREGMSLASLFGGLALANAGLGAVHGFAGPLGGMFHAPHGVLCARFLPLVMKANIKALESRQPEHPALARYTEIARILTGEKDATAKEGVEWTRELVNALKIPRLSAYGMKPEHFPEVVQKTQKASSFKGNPIILDEKELTEILEKTL